MIVVVAGWGPRRRNSVSTIGSASTVPGTAAGDSVVRGGSATHGSTHDSVDGGSVASHDSGHNLRASIERHESEDRHHDARSVGGDSVAFSDLALSELSRYRKKLFFSRKFKSFVHKKFFLPATTLRRARMMTLSAMWTAMWRANLHTSRRYHQSTSKTRSFRF